MSTSKDKMKYLWSVYFEDGHVINQPVDDRYSKHDESFGWNPSSFRDILDYQEKSQLVWFHLLKGKQIFAVNLLTGEFNIDGTSFYLDNEVSIDRKLIYFRDIEQQFLNGIAQPARIVSYNMGYEYKNNKGKVQKKVITFNG